jgi:hypothetical protein
MPKSSCCLVKEVRSVSLPDANLHHRFWLRPSLWLVGSALLAQSLLADLPAIAQTGTPGSCPPGYYQIEGPGIKDCAPIPGASAPPAPAPSRRQRQAPAPPRPQRDPVPENNWHADLRGMSSMGNGRCQAGNAPCWYAFWGSGATPYRKLYFADLQPRKPTSNEKNVVEMDIVTAFESYNPGDRVSHDHVLLTFQFQCKKQQIRLVDGYALLWNGKTNRVPEPSPWGPYQATWMEVASRVACDSNVRLRPQDNRLIWFGNMQSPADVVATTRRVLWQKSVSDRAQTTPVRY